MNRHSLVQVIHTGLLPLNTCHNRFPMRNLSCYCFKNQPYVTVSYIAPRLGYRHVLSLEQLLHVAKVVDE
jgi:arginine decarboxylase-like protein